MGEAAAAQPAGPLPAAPFRVLVVEDHAVIRGVIKLACEHAHGLEVIGEVETGEAAIERTHADDPDVIVLDLALPGELQGLDVARRLRSQGHRARILVLTASTDDQTLFDSIRAGVDGYLEKTVGVRFIGDALRRVARGERVFTRDQERARLSELGRLTRQTREAFGAQADLTERELEILEYVAVGLSGKQVASRLGLSPRTVETHLAKLYRKLGVRNRVQAISRAASLGLIELA
jgi:DNA-binding NarL/FixJ family response regulator